MRNSRRRNTSALEAVKQMAMNQICRTQLPTPLQLLASGYRLSLDSRQRRVIALRFDGQRSDGSCANHEKHKELHP
jgi:hypothetical protein